MNDILGGLLPVVICAYQPIAARLLRRSLTPTIRVLLEHGEATGPYLNRGSLIENTPERMAAIGIASGISVPGVAVLLALQSAGAADGPMISSFLAFLTGYFVCFLTSIPYARRIFEKMLAERAAKLASSHGSR